MTKEKQSEVSYYIDQSFLEVQEITSIVKSHESHDYQTVEVATPVVIELQTANEMVMKVVKMRFDMENETCGSSTEFERHNSV